MSHDQRRAVLTGAGLITPLGHDVGPFWAALRDGRSGVRSIQSVDVSALPTRFAGEVVDFDARDYLEKKDRKRLNTLARTIQFALTASQLALRDAGLDRSALTPERVGVCFGAGTIPSDLVELGPAAQISVRPGAHRVDMGALGDLGLPTIPPMWMLNHVPNMVACHVGILHDARGPNNTITQTDLGGLLALGEAWRVLRRGDSDVMLVGGADAKVNAITLLRQCLFSSLSRRNDSPEKACRPFERDRDGMVLGEGAGVLVLEDREWAQKRNARIYGEVVGFAAAFDRKRDGDGLARAVRTALAQAEIDPGQLDHVNAQGYATRATDVWEARGLRAALGPAADTVTAFAPKSYFGNLGPASGPVELAASLLAHRHAVLPGTLNYDVPCPECPVRALREARPVTKAHFLKVGLTEMGQCAAVVVRCEG